MAPFGLCALALVFLPAPIGPQDLAAQVAPKFFMARQPALASPFGTIHLATFSFPQPLGTAMPKPVHLTLASLDPNDMAVPQDRALNAIDIPAVEATPFPTVDRRRKGDALLPPPRPEPAQKNSAAVSVEPVLSTADDDGVWPELSPSEMASALNPTMDTARLYFGSLDVPPTTLERPEQADTPPVAAKEAVAKPEPVKGGETIAGKGVVDNEPHRPRSPAERLGLSGKTRAKAEKCLANAVYFESRGEPVRGQMAVAQVVMNRVFSEFYPDNVCDVVYQNAGRHLACQFTFACDGIPDVVTEPDAWRRAKLIAKDTLDGKIWVEEVGKATHYHAYWVRPSWVHEMKKLYKLGVHTFYRPRAWGSGADEPNWGDPKATAALAKKL
jgi:spore germination cell wall hydrolase CwlJ-like protein